MEGWRRNEVVIRESVVPASRWSLVCDQFKAHVTESTKRLATKLKMHLAVIPGGLTSQLQPLTFIIIFFSKISNEKITVHLMGWEIR